MSKREQACFWCRHCLIAVAAHDWTDAQCYRGHWDASDDYGNFNLVKLRREALAHVPCQDFEEAEDLKT